jgi:hypothetical protein
MSNLQQAGDLNQAHYHAHMAEFFADLALARHLAPASPYGRAVGAAIEVLAHSGNRTARGAARLLSQGLLHPTAQPHTWTCPSETTKGLTYIVTPGRCSCRPGQYARCKHRVAATILDA